MDFAHEKAAERLDDDIHFHLRVPDFHGADGRELLGNQVRYELAHRVVGGHVVRPRLRCGQPE